MRITNKIMQSNSLSNINTNKIMQDKLNTQMATQKKITRPSDDPVIAIRALRLRSNVSEVTQYYSKNIPDAESWLNVTEDAIKNTAAVITDMIKQCTKGSNGPLKSADREIILEQLKALRDEVYATGDADYAGRYVFTGYRTDVSLKFPTAETLKYEITEQLDKEALSSMTVVKTTDTVGGDVVDLKDLNNNNYEDIAVSETKVESFEVNRIRLAYEKLDAGTAPVISWTNPDGTAGTVTADVVNSYDTPSPYEQINLEANKDKVIFVPQTGEMLIGSNVYDKLMTTKDDATTGTVDEGEIRITYEKSEWLADDLRPEHYFACTATDDKGVQTEYNKNYLDFTYEGQVIEYDVGFNQTIRVNTTADECFDPNIGREVDDLINALTDVQEMEKVVTKMENVVKTATGTQKETAQARLDAANKALTLMKDKCQKLFEKGITTMQGFLDSANLAITDCGTRGSKLELIENRMQSQKTTFETLKSENEDADITEVAIHLTSSKLTYEAALMATGKTVQNTLLNFL